MSAKCNSLRQLLIDHMADAVKVHHIGDACAVTLPISTVDGRLVDVFVEQRMGDYCIVHDGGKAVNELLLQGVTLTESITNHFNILARRFGVSYVDESFNTAGKIASAQTMILAVGMCSGTAMAQIVGQIATLAEEPLRQQVGTVVRGWARSKYRLSPDVVVPGGHAKHRFDFVAYPKQPRNSNTVAMSVLLPGSNSLAAAERFGFKTTDLAGTNYGAWRKVAVQGRSETWSAEAKAILKHCADIVIELRQDVKIDAGEIKDKLDFVAIA